MTLTPFYWPRAFLAKKETILAAVLKSKGKFFLADALVAAASIEAV
jgi:hypothetical protein